MGDDITTSGEDNLHRSALEMSSTILALHNRTQQELQQAKLALESQAAELRDSHARLLAIINSVDGIVWEANAETFNFTFVSPRAERLLGYPVQQWINEPSFWSDHIHPDDRASTVKFCVESTKQTCNHEIEYRMLALDGRVLWLRDIVAVTSESGRPVKLHGIMVDITERKKAEVALRESEASLNFALETSAAGAWDLDLVNHTANRTLGHDKIFGYCDLLPEWTYEKFIEHVLPEERADVDLRFKEATATQSDWSFECRIRRVDGAIRWIWVKGRHGGNRMSGVVHDITERKQVEIARQLSEIRYRAIIESTPVPIALNDEHQNITYLNPAFVQTFGYTLKDIPSLSHWWPQAYPDPTYRQWVTDTWLAELSRAKQTRTPFSGIELRIRCKDGTTKYVLATASTITASFEGEHLVQLFDITERKRLEKEREQVTSDLRESEAFNLAVLDSLSEHIAVLDGQGVIIAVNRAWKKFGELNGQVRSSIGQNYLTVCAQAAKNPFGEEASAVEAGIRSVLDGTTGEFAIEYPCHGPHQQRWFQMGVTPLRGSKKGAVLRHENITSRKLGEDALRLAKDFSQSVLDGLPYLICVVDKNGTIVAINQAWRVYVLKSGMLLERVSEGRNYLAICDTALGRDSVHAKLFASGIRDVLSGKKWSYMQEYIAQSQSGTRRLIGKVTCFSGKEKEYAIVAHEDVTKWRIAEDELRDMEKKLALALNSTKDGMWDWDIENNNLVRNDRWATMLGYTPNEIESSFIGWKNLVHREDLAQAEDAIRASHEGRKELYEVEFRMKRKEGGWCWILSRGSVVQRDKKGVPLRMVGTHTDITSRKNAEQCIQNLHERLELAISGSGFGIWEYDLETNLLEWDDAMYALYGHTRATFDGNPDTWRQCVFADDRDMVNERFTELLKGGRVNNLEFRIIRASDSTIVYIEANGCMQSELSGATHRLVGMNRDISVTRKAERALRESEEQLRSVLNTAAEGIVLIDVTGLIRLFNRAAVNIFGYTESEILGRPIELLMPSPHKENHASYILNYLNTGKSGIIGKGRELVATKKDRSPVPIYLNVSETRQSDKIFFTGIVRDLTEQKRAEEERQKLEQQYAQSQKMEALGVLAGGIAHDFNNILASILGYTEVAKSKTVDERVSHALDQVLKASLRARNLIKQVLIFSRTGTAKFQSTDLKAILQETLQQILLSLPAGVHVDQNIMPEKCWVMGDSIQLHQLLLNLFTNAYQAMPDGGQLGINLETDCRDKADLFLPLEPGTYALITVSDTGTGMSEEIQHRIFEPFFSTKGARGTGLGLSVVHGVIKKHGGAIKVESREGKGSKFSIWIPIAIEERPSSASLPALEFKGSGTALIIDDDDMVLSLTSEMFRDHGFAVEAFSDPIEALNALNIDSARFALLVTDYSMTALSGLEVIDRAHKIRPELPAILMTGYGDTVIYERNRNDFLLLTKPFRLSELKAVLRQILAK